MVGACFAVVTSAPRMRLMTEHLLDRYGFRSQCCGVRTTPIHVLDLCNNPDKVIDDVVHASVCARDEDKAEVIVLGCAGMSPYQAVIERRVRLPVIDGTVAAIKLCEAMVDMGLKTSKFLTFDYPVHENDLHG
uniref:Hydantoin racemase n=1 Tax=Lygus hesperus TaxID=30085 RepID=A0A0A9XTC7_LYGHE